MRVSTLILTLNEEINLPYCLNSLTWCDDIVVLDSYSSDRTHAICMKKGVRFGQRKFDDYARQRNFGLNEIEYKHPWILMMDADEIIPPELVEEIRVTLDNGDPNICLYRLRIKYYLMGRWLRYSSGYPTWYGRLQRKGTVLVEGSINEHCQTDGKIGYLNKHLLHYPFNKGFHAWLEKHNRYSSMEAEAMMASSGLHDFRFRDLCASDPVIRRQALKKLLYLLPGRPLLMFCGLYFLRLGFLDGRPGMTFCLLRTFYEYMIDCKLTELKRRQNGLTV